MNNWINMKDRYYIFSLGYDNPGGFNDLDFTCISRDEIINTFIKYRSHYSTHNNTKQLLATILCDLKNGTYEVWDIEERKEITTEIISEATLKFEEINKEHKEVQKKEKLKKLKARQEKDRLEIEQLEKELNEEI